MVELTRGQLIAWGIAAAIAVFAAFRLLSPGGPAQSSAPPPPVKVGGEQRRQSLYVHVAGAVRRPGLYRLAGSARVGAALEHAGGPLRRADLSAVNLAATVEDGQQIRVPRIGERPAAGASADTSATGSSAPGASAAGGGGASVGAAKLSLASATVEQLDQLDGIGPTLAKRIVQFREEKGGFRSVEQLRDVEGIGEKRFAALREAVGP
jgi:competence protein ComEA